MTINDLLTSHFGFKVDLNYLRIDHSKYVYTEEGFEKLLKIVEKKIESTKKDPEWAYYYSVNVIKGRWKEGEEVIKKDPEWAYWYSLNIIKSRWPEGEETIKQIYIYWESYKNFFGIVRRDNYYASQIVI